MNGLAGSRILRVFANMSNMQGEEAMIRIRRSIRVYGQRQKLVGMRLEDSVIAPLAYVALHVVGVYCHALFTASTISWNIDPLIGGQSSEYPLPLMLSIVSLV